MLRRPVEITTLSGHGTTSGLGPKTGAIRTLIKGVFSGRRHFRRMDLHCVKRGDSDEAIADPRDIFDDARA